jgi:hypothetical protein
MVSAKDLRDVFEDIRKAAGKRAVGMMSDAKLPEIGRRSEPPGMLWLGLGLALGAVVGMAIALVMAPFPGEEARRRLTERVEKMRRPVEDDQIEHLRTSGNGNVGTPVYSTPTSAYERS